MKIYNNYLLLVCLLFVSACNISKSKREKTTKEGVPKFVIREEIHNFGILEAGEVVSFSFRYENKGTGLLKIDSVDFGCGCLQVDWLKDELAENEFDYIQVTFNSAGEWGNIYKPIVIFTNTKKNQNNIYITAKINNQLFN